MEVEAEDGHKMEPYYSQVNTPSSDWMTLETSRICFVDGAWRLQDKFSGQDWFYKINSATEKMMEL